MAEKEKSTISLGDLVRLKSGGPTMTVGSIDDYGYAYCTWHNKAENKIIHEKISESALIVLTE